MSGAEALHSQVCASEAQTRHIAASLAAVCESGDCVLLRGDLGVGKTAFARGFIQALSPEIVEVVSPTFTVVQTYPTQSGITVWHFDLYRLKSADEVLEIGLDEALQSGITLIEWPEIIAGSLPESALGVTISAGNNPEARQLHFNGLACVWKNRLEQIG